MAQGRKYGTLPDLDSAPAVYATPDPIEDSAAQGRTTSPTSPASPSSYKDFDSASDASETSANDSSRVDRHKIRPSAARTRFRPSRVDARGVDFSDRISGGRKSYRVHSVQRRSRQRALDGGEEDGEEESLEERIARLRRETVEVQAELERRKGEEQGSLGSEVVDLSKTLHEVQESSRVLQRSAIEKSAGMNGNVVLDETASAAQLPPTDENTQQVLSRAAVLEARLSVLETSLGAMPPGAQSTEAPSSIINTLSALESKVSLINSTSLPAIESFARQIKQLSDDADKLAVSRRTAKQTFEALVQQQRSSPSGPRSRPGTANSDAPHGQVNGDVSITSVVEDAEQRTKIEAIYRTLQTIESLSTSVPLVLERLKTLRTLHVDAAQASEVLSAVEKRQAQFSEDIRKWQEALDGVEEALKKAEQNGVENRGVVESWVQNLEERLGKVEIE